MKQKLSIHCIRQCSKMLSWSMVSVGLAIGLSACSSDKPTFLEPHVATLAATDISRTEATLNGTATVEGEMTLPQLRFRYGTTEDMPLTALPVDDDATWIHSRVTGLTAGTTYYYRLEGSSDRATVKGGVMSFATQPNEKPSLGEATIISHGPMSVLVGYEITDDGGERITETGCLYALASSDEKSRVALSDYRGGKGRQKLLLDNLARNSTYRIWPYAKSRAGEAIGSAITVATSDAVSLGEAGQLRALMGDGIYDYTTLSVAGPLDGDDFNCMRAMMGCGKDGTVTSGKLSEVDMTDAVIVAGGGPYDGARYTQDNVVGQGVFADCASLSKVCLPIGAAVVEKDAFARCSSLTDMEIPASVSSLLPSSGCVGLRSIGVSAANDSYASVDGVLLNADMTQVVWFPMGKEGAYTLPPTVGSIGDYAFKECSIETFIFPDGVKELGMGAFMNSKVREVTLPANLRLIPTATFQGCTALHVVRLGRKTEMVSDYAFDRCPLTDIYIDAPLPPVCSAKAFATSGPSIFATCKIHVSQGKANLYKASDGWKQFKNIITD